MLHTPVGMSRNISRGFFSIWRCILRPRGQRNYQDGVYSCRSGLQKQRGCIWCHFSSAELCAVCPGTAAVARVVARFEMKSTPWETILCDSGFPEDCGTSVGIGKNVLAAAVGMEYKPDRLMTFQLPSLCNQWSFLSFFLTAASRLEYLKIRVFWGMPDRIRNDPWLYLSEKAGPLVPTRRILPPRPWGCRWGCCLHRGSSSCKWAWPILLKSRIWHVSQIVITYI